MNISEPVLKLYDTDIFNILSFVYGITDNEWNAWNLRQEVFDIHSATKTYPLRWAQEVDENTYQVTVKNRTSIINQILFDEINKLEHLYDGTCINILFAKLLPHSEIPPHGDVSRLLTNVHRIHLPLITNEDVDFYVDDVKYNFREGTLYEINNSLTHSVENNSTLDRIHLILDILPNNKNINLKYTYQ